jgi:hypothetical protein
MPDEQKRDHAGNRRRRLSHPHPKDQQRTSHHAAEPVREALADVPPEIAESAIGRAALAGALVEAAAELLAEQTDPAFARRVVVGLVERWRR